MSERLPLLLTAEKIDRRVGELAKRINEDYADRDNPLFLGVLHGAAVFLADLIRKVRIPVAVDFLRAASYGASTETTGVVQIRKDVEAPVAGRHVLVIEDIVDTGLTVDFLLRHLAAGGPKTLEVCTLLDKPFRRRVSLTPKYVGFQIGDLFVVGYGMDYNDQYRQLPAIHYLDPPPGDTPQVNKA